MSWDMVALAGRADLAGRRREPSSRGNGVSRKATSQARLSAAACQSRGRRFFRRRRPPSTQSPLRPFPPPSPPNPAPTMPRILPRIRSTRGARTGDGGAQPVGGFSQGGVAARLLGPVLFRFLCSRPIRRARLRSSQQLPRRARVVGDRSPPAATTAGFDVLRWRFADGREGGSTCAGAASELKGRELD